MRKRTWLFIFALALTAGACGKKAPPQPVEQRAAALAAGFGAPS